MATKKASALKAFITGIVCIIMIGLGWLSDPLTAADQTSAISRILAWCSLAAAAISLIVAIYFTFRALAIREPQKDSDLEPEPNDRDNNPGPNSPFE
jgi:heme/copper-type cytochrome/quinol oxidase subunit 2